MRTEELSETCRVSFQNKCEKLVHLVGLIIRKFVTIHGHVNEKKCYLIVFLRVYNSIRMGHWQAYLKISQLNTGNVNAGVSILRNF
jgi:hypothetical protein